MTKSKKMEDQGRLAKGSGCRTSGGGCGETLLRVHKGQADTNFPIFLSMDGHQKLCLMKNRVHHTPWQQENERMIRG